MLPTNFIVHACVSVPFLPITIALDSKAAYTPADGHAK